MNRRAFIGTVLAAALLPVARLFVAEPEQHKPVEPLTFRGVPIESDGFLDDEPTYLVLWPCKTIKWEGP